MNILKNTKQIFNKLKHTNRRITRIIILLSKRLSQVYVTTEMIMIKNNEINTQTEGVEKAYQGQDTG